MFVWCARGRGELHCACAVESTWSILGRGSEMVVYKPWRVCPLRRLIAVLLLLTLLMWIVINYRLICDPIADKYPPFEAAFVREAVKTAVEKGVVPDKNGTRELESKLRLLHSI